VRVLIVDDSEIMRNGLSDLFTRQGYSVETHDSGFGVVKRVLKTRPGVVVLDHNLGPDQPTGLEIAQMLRRYGFQVVLTSSEDLSDRFEPFVLKGKPTELLMEVMRCQSEK